MQILQQFGNIITSPVAIYYIYNYDETYGVIYEVI